MIKHILVSIFYAVLIVFGSISISTGQTNLAVGELVILGVNTDSEDFTFLLLTDIDAGTEIYFTDNETNTSTSINTGEGLLKYTAPSFISCGTVIGLIANSSNFSSEEGSFVLGNSGDEVIAFQGYNPGTRAVTTFLHAVSDATISPTPSGLSSATLIDLSSDNGQYSGTTTGTKASLYSAVNTLSNWTQNNSFSSTTLATSTFTVTDCAPPSADTEVNFTSATSTVTEDGLFVDVCATITNPSATDATTVDVILNGGTAINGTDYDDGAATPAAIVFPIELTFPANSSADQCFDIFISNDDTNVEGDETVVLELDNASGGTNASVGSANTHTLTIIDNDIAANDDCAVPVNLTVNAAAVNGNMLGVTPTNGTLNRNDVWYTFTPTCTGTHTITASFAAGPDLDIEVYPASFCPTSTSGRLANGNSSNATSETLSFPGAVGSTAYLIRVIDFDGDADAFTIQVTTSAAPSFTLANNGTPAAGSIDVNTANEVLYGFALTPADCPGTYDFTACNIQTAGTATSADLSNFRLIVDADNDGVADASEIASPIGTVASLADPLAFTGLGQTGLSATVRYLLIADVTAGATAGRTFTASMAAVDVNAAETVTGTANGNAQTIFAPAPPCSELFISEYHEGASGNEKYLEIYNPTSSAITLTGTYSLVSYVNGSASVSNTLNLTGSLGAYTAGYIRNSTAALSSGALASDGSVMTFNGNDAIALRKNGTNVDVIGTIGNSANYGVDVVLRRNASVEAPTTSYDPLEWSSSAANDVSDIGSHLSDCFIPNPEATISINTTTGTEDAETAITLTISTDAAVTGDQTVQVTLGGTGVTNGDFTGVTFPVTVTILNGQDEATVSFTVNNDADVEGDETATFTIGSPSSGINIGTPSSVALDIDDNDNLTSTESAVVSQGGESGTIPSLTNGTITNNTQGVQVWHFRLYDGDGSGNDADDKPTRYSGFTIRPAAGNTVPDWGAAINDVEFFRDAEATPIFGGGVLTSASTITFSIPSAANHINVADNGFVDIYMRLTLENNLPSGSDGQHFAFSIDDSDVNVNTDALTYSQLGTFTATSDAADNEIDILATLQFIDAPTTVSIGSNFSITVSAIDANGNVDVDVTSPITLAQTGGAGTLSGTTTANLVNGTFTFTGLNHDTEESVQVTASGGSYSSVSVNVNVVDLPYQLFDDFNRTDNNTVGIPSSGGSTAWTEQQLSGELFRASVNGNQLYLGGCAAGVSSGSTGGTGMEQVRFNVENFYETLFDNAGGTLEWFFNMKQTRTDPSGFGSNTYAVAVILGCDENDFQSANADGYAVVIGNTSTPDPVRLVRFSGGLTSNDNVENVAVTGQNDADAYYSVHVTFDPCNGAWSIAVRDDGDIDFASPNVGSLGAVVTGTDQTHTGLDLRFFGAAWQHSSSCSEFARFDNFNIPNVGSATTTAKVWNGSVNDNWNEPNNWGPCPGVPTLTNDVVIPNTVPQPVISSAPAGFCKNLTLETGSQLTINSGHFLNVYGNVLNNGNPAFGDGTISMEGAGSATVTGLVQVGNFHADKTTTLNSTVTVSEQVRSELNGNIVTNGNLLLLSGAELRHGTGTAAGGGSVTGNITMQRQGTSLANVYNYWSTPVAGGVLPGGNGYLYDPTQGTLDNSDDATGNGDSGWLSHSGIMTAGRGYASTAGGLASFVGVPNDDDIPFAVINAASNNRFNLVGNPYPSPISATTFLNINGPSGINRIAGALYFWSNDQPATSTVYDTDDYAVWSGIGSAGASGPVPNGSVATGQGFMVEALSSGNIQFTNAMRGGINTQFFKLEEETYMDRLWLNMHGGSKYNQVLVAFRDDATEQRDPLFDAYKVRGSAHIALGAVQEDEEFVIVAFPSLTIDRVVPLLTYVSESGSYTFEADSLDGFTGYSVYLEDLQSGQLHPLQQGSTVTVQMGPQDEYGRFQLRFMPELITGVDDTQMTEGRVIANELGLQVLMYGVDRAQGELHLINALGQSVQRTSVTVTDGLSQHIPMNGIPAGVYFGEFRSENGLARGRFILH